jgi:hypothetical protein
MITMLRNKYILSAYHINALGVLCYAGLPVGMPNPPIEFKHHNGCEYFPGAIYGGAEVYGVMIDHLLHGRPGRVFDYSEIKKGIIKTR